MMQGMVLIVIWLLAATGVAGAELRASPPLVRNEVTAVIEAQLAAFRSGDVGAAYGHASASLRAQIPLRTFAAIIRSNYGEVWASERAEFGLVRDDGGRAAVRVHVWSAGRRAAFDYALLRESEGWRIGSVVRYVPGAKDAL